MSKVLVVTSGKGGVGKTTTTAALGAALAQGGQSVCVVDFDVGLRNLDLIMGAERRVVYDLINVVNGDAKLPQALIKDKRLDTLHLLPASQTRDKDALTDEGVARVMEELREQVRLGDLRQPRRHRARRPARHAPRRRGGGGDQPRGLLGARLRPHHRHARQQDRQGRDGRARWRSTCSSPATTRCGPTAATCSRPRTCSTSCRSRCWRSSPRARRCCSASNLGCPVTLNDPTAPPAAPTPTRRAA